MRACLLGYRKVIAGELRQRGRRNLDHHVDATRKHFSNTRIAISDRTEDYGFGACFTIPVPVMPGNNNSLIGLPCVKFESSGADRLATEILAMLLNCSRRGDQPCRIGKI